MILRLLTTILFFQLSFLSFAQQSKFMDSLLVELKKLPGREVQCDRLSELAFVVINENPEYAKQCADLLTKISKEINYKKGQAYARYHLGNINYYMDEFDEGINNLTAARKIFKQIGDEKGMGLSSNTLGEILTSSGGYNGALKELFDALEHFDKAGSPEGIAWVNNNIGRVHYYQSNYSEALKYFNQALKSADVIRSGDAWLYITFVYIDQDQFTKAEESVAKAFEFAQKNNDQYVLADCYYCLGRIEAYYGRNDLAREHLNSARDMKSELEDYQGWALASVHLADLLLKLDDIQTSLKLFREAASIASSVGVKVELKDAYLGLSNVFNRLQMYDSAYYYLRIQNDLTNELVGEEASKKLAELESSLQERERTKEEENERKIREAKESAAKREKELMLTAGIIVIVMLLVFLGFMVNRNRMKQRANKQLELFNRQITEQKHLIEEKHKEITDSINYAERIQRSLLASKKLLDENLSSTGSETRDYFIFFKPKDVVSGDFYWATKLNNDHFILVTADSTGHGVPGAIMGILNISCLEKAVEVEKLISPNEILNHTRTKIIDILKKDGSAEGGKDGMDGSLLSFDFKSNLLYCASANNPVWIVRAASSKGVDTKPEIIEIIADRYPIGKHERDNIPFTLHTLDIQKGDVVYALTDGFSDQFGGAAGKKFKSKKLQELLLSIAQEPMSVQKQKLNDVFENWRGNLEQVDDVTIIGIRI